MDSQQLLQVMQVMAHDLSKKKDPPAGETVIGSYLTRKKSKTSTELAAFKLATGAVLNANEHKEDAKKTWPNDWQKGTFADLAKAILPILVFLLSFLPASSQFQITLGGGVSSLKESFVLFGIEYGKTRDSVWQTRNNFIAGKNSFTSFYPSFKYRAGSADLPNIADLKVEGLTMVFKNKRIATVSRAGVTEDIIAPDLSKTFHTFPFSAGLEMSGPGIEKLTEFNTINGIIEWGWVPWFQQIDALDNVEFGVFLQGGYKFYKVQDSARGAEVDESLEKPKSGIFRLRVELGGTIDTLVRRPVGVGVEGFANVWADIANGGFYKSAQGNVLIYISQNSTLVFGFTWGSGMPLANNEKYFTGGVRFKF